MDEISRAVLDLAGEHYRYRGAQEAAIRLQFGWTRTRYFQVLNALIDTAEAQEYAPVTCHRYQRLRDNARAARGAQQ